MTRIYKCDQCNEIQEHEPFELGYWCAEDDDGISDWAEVHLCSWSCLMALAMEQSVQVEG